MKTVTNMSSAGHAAKARSTTIERTFDAPVELVWNAWTEPAALAKWFGPRGSNVEACKFDLQPGGAIEIELQLANARQCTICGRFLQIVERERLVISLDRAPWMSEHASAVQMVTFEELAGKTLLKIHTATNSRIPFEPRKKQPCPTPTAL